MSDIYYSIFKRLLIDEEGSSFMIYFIIDAITSIEIATTCILGLWFWLVTYHTSFFIYINDFVLWF